MTFARSGYFAATNSATNLRVLVIGLGLIGRQRAEAVFSLESSYPIRLAGTVDPSATSPLDAPHFQDLAQVDPTSFDAAIVAVPHDLAAKIVIDLLEGGHPIFIEKPLGMNRDEAERIRNAASAIEAPSFVGYNYRFLLSVRQMFEALRDGKLGKLRTVDFLLGHGGHPGSAEGWKLLPERAGGGVLIDPGVHLLDLLLCIAPEAKCTHVAGTAGFWGTGIEEDVVATFQHADLLATIRVSHIRWVNTFRLEIVGEDGYAIAEGRGGTYGTQTLRIGRRWGWRDGKSQRESEQSWNYGDANTSFADETAAVANIWLGGIANPNQPHPATMDEALSVALLCGEMYDILAPGDSQSAIRADGTTQ